MPRNKRYTGILAQPMLADSYSEEEVSRRFAALVDHYGIDRNDPDFAMKLARDLACAHVPGFKVRPRKPPGKPAQYSLIWLTLQDFRNRKEVRPNALNSTIIRSMWKTGDFYQRLYKERKSLERMINRNIDIEFDIDRFIEDWKRRHVPAQRAKKQRQKSNQ